jgi:hypothetical protein
LPETWTAPMDATTKRAIDTLRQRGDDYKSALEEVRAVLVRARQMGPASLFDPLTSIGAILKKHGK